MYKSVILPLAKQDIREAASWYNSKQKGLGKQLTKIIRQKIRFLRNNPKTAPLRYDHIRCAVLNVFPFMIHYSVDDELETIIVSAFLHTSRNPDMWNKRK